MLTYSVMTASVLSTQCAVMFSENFLPRSLFKLPIITPVRSAQSSNLQTKLGKQFSALPKMAASRITGGVVFVVLVILNTDSYCHVLPRLKPDKFFSFV